MTSLSDDLAQSLLDGLSSAQRDRLVAAMAEVETLMAAAAVTIGIEPEDSRDAQQCIAAYYKELDERFESGFDPGNGGYAGKPPSAQAAGCFLIARLNGRAIGCGALKPIDASTGEIKRMWVAPEARGSWRRAPPARSAGRPGAAVRDDPRRARHQQVACPGAGALPQGRLPRDRSGTTTIPTPISGSRRS